MAVRIRLSDRSSLIIDSTYAKVSAGVERALAYEIRLIEVKNGAGKRMCINPRQIACIVETDEEELTPGEQQILISLRERRQVQAGPLAAASS